MAILYGLTLFLSATLLFWVQPMMAKMLLPLLGGSPSVWNTCMVFFQAALLGGYLYAHTVSHYLRTKTQVVAHLLLLGMALFFLPMRVTEGWIGTLPETGSPAGWLLLCLLAVVGLPFFLLSSTAPLLQRWFSRTGHTEAHDPYFLYSASNLGSMLALLGYPFLLEPFLSVPGQTLTWTWGFMALGLLVGLCGWQLWKLRPEVTSKADGIGSEPKEEERTPHHQDETSGLTWKRRLYWVLLAFVPSSLMLGVTTFLSTDIASLPLLWVVPLSLYLLTFVIVFARRPVLSVNRAARIMPYATLGLIFLIITRTTEPVWLLVVLHLLFFFIAAMVCHGRLAADRPSARFLTEFYIWMSVGGVAGGIFNALAAPVLFRDVLEYPLAIVLACLLILPRSKKEGGEQTAWLYRDAVLPALLGLATFTLAWGAPRLGLDSGPAGRALVAGVPAVFVFFFSWRPMRFGLGVAAVLLGGWHFLAPKGETLHVERNFFGVSRVQYSDTENLNRLIHGNTFHGEQWRAPDQQCQPTAYYHPKGPFSEVVSIYKDRPASPQVAVIGLGSGTMATFISPGEEWTFYEIDPAVIRIAQDTNYFTFLNHCSQGDWKIIPGDARLKLQKAPDQHYGMIILDAFSSDAIPLHLITREALALYLSKLAPNGILIFHISNRYLDVRPVLGTLAAEAGLQCRSWHEQLVSPEDKKSGKVPSHWAVLARAREDLGLLNRRTNWEPVEALPGFPVWTDDYSNIMRVMTWK